VPVTVPYHPGPLYQQPDGWRPLTRWTEEEHFKFVRLVKKYGRNWNKIHRHMAASGSYKTEQ
jgi:hypothetical protein